jgi:quinol-cytochrome oxidoreductase complex cytochrome b subunit
MTGKQLLLLLLPYAALVVWALRGRVFRPVPVLLLASLTLVVVSSILNAAYVHPPLNSANPDEAFASVEEIMQEVHANWVERYLITQYGWPASAAFFLVCWLVAYVTRPRERSAA